MALVTEPDLPQCRHALAHAVAVSCSHSSFPSCFQVFPTIAVIFGKPNFLLWLLLECKCMTHRHQYILGMKEFHSKTGFEKMLSKGWGAANSTCLPQFFPNYGHFPPIPCLFIEHERQVKI
jgi:hypothetical protein